MVTVDKECTSSISIKLLATAATQLCTLRGIQGEFKLEKNRKHSVPWIVKMHISRNKFNEPRFLQLQKHRKALKSLS